MGRSEDMAPRKAELMARLPCFDRGSRAGWKPASHKEAGIGTFVPLMPPAVSVPGTIGTIWVCGALLPVRKMEETAMLAWIEKWLARQIWLFANPEGLVARAALSAEDRKLMPGKREVGSPSAGDPH